MVPYSEKRFLIFTLSLPFSSQIHLIAQSPSASVTSRSNRLLYDVDIIRGQIFLLQRFEIGVNMVNAVVGEDFGEKG